MGWVPGRIELLSPKSYHRMTLLVERASSQMPGWADDSIHVSRSTEMSGDDVHAAWHLLQKNIEEIDEDYFCLAGGVGVRVRLQ